MKARSWLVGSVMAAFLGAMLVGVPTADAAPPSPVRASAPAAAEDPELSVLFMLDVSGSMNRKLPGTNQTLLDAAKVALGRVSQSMPAKAALGLRVYGATYGGEDKTKSCADTQLEVPIKEGGASDLVEATNGLTAIGDTPISRSLVAASKDFSGDDARVIVLISDGEDTCSPPGPTPCNAAKQLQKNKVKVRVETVGFHLAGNQSAIEALQCIARVSGGDYYSADDANGLSAALNRIAENTLGQLGAGRPIEGGKNFQKAPLIEPGVYTDTLTRGQSKWYRFEAEPENLPEVLATIEGLNNIDVPRGAEGCRAWEAALYNPILEGGKYPPYHNDNEFDGAGLAGTGVRSSKPIDSRTDGIDYPGTWGIKLSLAAETQETCSEHLPGKEEFDLRFSLTTGAAEVKSSDKALAKKEREKADPTEAAETQDSDAADSFDAPAGSEDGNSWALPLIGVCLVLIVGGGAFGYVRWRRNRYY